MHAHPKFASANRPRLKVALLGAVGGALVLLPLGQVLHHQGAELEALAAQRAALDPMTHALGVQRSLLAHRDATDHVLRGRTTLEAERRMRQAELEQRLRDLQDTLTAGWWIRALQECQSLAADWRQLTRRVLLRQINAPDSLHAHQLLSEQAVQVMDLVQATAPSGAGKLVARAAHQLQQHPPATPLHQQQALAALEDALLAMDAQLLQRAGDLKAQRATLGLALGALLALALTAAVRRVPRGTPTPPAEAGDTQQRRTHGRRATDQGPQRDTAGQVLDRMRAGTPSSSEEQS